MGKIEWSMWANEQALVSSMVVILGGIISVAGMFKNYHFGIYGIWYIGVHVGISQRTTAKGENCGKTLLKLVDTFYAFQRPFTLLVQCGGLVTRNYFVRFVIYLLLCVPCCFALPTLLGGMCFLITSAVYFVAALKSEEWKPAGLDLTSESEGSGSKVIQPPRHPPPRLADDAPSNQINQV